LVIFEIELPEWTWVVILLFVLPCVAVMTGVCHHTQPLVGMTSGEIFAQVASNHDLPDLWLPSAWP
jgi:hypothetical protein